VLVKAVTPPLFSNFRSHRIAFDTEGTGLIPYGPTEYWGYYPARPFAFAFCDGEGNTAYFRWKVKPETRQVIPGTKAELDILRRIAQDDRLEVVGHNIAYDFRMLEAMDFTVTTRHVHDTMVLAHVVTAGDELSYALKPLCKKYLAFPDDDEKELEHAVADARREAKAKGWLIAGGKKDVERGERVVFAGNKPIKADYWLAPPEMCQRYAVGDVERAMMLYLLMEPALDRDRRIRATYEREMQLFWVLRKMEKRGTRVYPDWTKHLVVWYTQYMVKMRVMADRHGGAGMNFMSPKQLTKKFYTELGYEPMYTDKGNMTLGKDKLAELGATDEDTGEFKDPLAKAVLEWRAAKQSIKSFLNIYAKFWYPTSYPSRSGSTVQTPSNGWDVRHGVWILHPNYNQTGAVTGRMTCSDPNLQQVASATTGLRKADIPARPRECFGPRPGCLWYLPDYSQIEVWLFAFMSREKNMQELLLSGYDFHQGVADKSFTRKPDYEQRKKYYRKLAKLIMFGKLYGGGVGTEQRPGRMTKLLQMPFQEAKAFIDSFEEQFSSVVEFMRRMTREATANGEAWNLYGRRYKLEREWAYKVVNYLIQGSAADLLKVATMRVDWMLDNRWGHPLLGLLNTVHDEMIIEVPFDLHSMRLMQEIVWVMQMDSTHCGIPVPLPVGMKVAWKRWSHTTDIALPAWVKGGVPRDETPFAELREFMQDCPYKVEDFLKQGSHESRSHQPVQRHLSSGSHHTAKAHTRVPF
jgi:DNA polymerase I-like protein with 3'-5' exonuclease and polymerase domains